MYLLHWLFLLVLGPVRPRTIKPFLPFFLSWRHSLEKRYQALSRFTVLQVMESWARPGNEANVLPYCTLRFNQVVEFCHVIHYMTVSVAKAVLKTTAESQSIFYAPAAVHRLYFSQEVCTCHSRCLRVHYLKSVYVIQLVAFQWVMACIHTSSPDLFLFTEVGLAC